MTSPTSPVATTTAPGIPSWTGNTCYSPPASNSSPGPRTHAVLRRSASGTCGCTWATLEDVPLRALTPAVVREWDASAPRRRGGRTSISSTSIRRVAGISRDDIEDYEVRPSGSPGVKGALSANTHRQRLQTLRASLERLIEWDWPDAPPRNPVLGGDIPEKPRAAAEVPRPPRHRTLPVPARRRRRTAARHQRHLTH